MCKHVCDILNIVHIAAYHYVTKVLNEPVM